MRYRRNIRITLAKGSEPVCPFCGSDDTEMVGNRLIDDAEIYLCRNYNPANLDDFRCQKDFYRSVK